MDKFQNKYRIPSARATWWDYANNGLYFITICTAGRIHYFGEIANEMQLTSIGRIALQCWFDIPNHFPFVKLDAFVVMPNHVHGILEIAKSTTLVETQNFASHSSGLQFPEVDSTGLTNASDDPTGSHNLTDNFTATHNASDEPTGTHNVTDDSTGPRKFGTETNEAQNIASLRLVHNKFGPQSRNLASIVRGYKTGVKKYATIHNIGFAWQPRFHDHIIRNDEEYYRICNYITENPSNWKQDTFFLHK